MIKKITLIYLFFGFLSCVGLKAYSQLNFSTPSIGFTQACGSSGFNTFNFSFSFFPASALQPGNQFIVELSNSSGSFASPTIVKVLTNTTSPVSSNFNLPSNTYGPGYRIRVRSTAPVKISNPSNAFPAYYAVHNQPFSVNSNVGTVSICENDTYTLQIDNNGTPASPLYYPSLQYRWLKNFEVIPGATGSSITVSEPGSYYAEVDYGTCSMNSYSNIVQVQVMSNLSPSITSENNSTIICPGGTNTLTSSLTSSSYTYQWYKDNIQIAGATSTTYAASESGVYHLVVANGPCVFESDFIALDLTDFNLTVNPSATTIVIPGEAVALTATDDANAPTYQWYKDNVAISGATSSIYNATEAGTYKVAVSQTTPCATIKESAVTVVYPTSFDLAIQPTTAYTACISNNATLGITSFVANTFNGPVDLSANPYNYTLQWYRNDVAVPGANSNQLILNNAAQNGTYKLLITAGSYGEVTSNTFDVNLAPGAVAITGSTTLCEGSDVLLTSSISDPDYSYQWYKDGVAISGAVASTLSVTAEGDYYVIIGSGSCTQQSNTLSVQLAQITVSTTTPLTDIILPGQTKPLAVTTNAQGATYSWTRNSAALTETTGTLNATQNGTYTVSVTQTIGCSVTEQQTFILEYPSGFDITIATAAGYTACTSGSTTLQTASFTATTTQGIMDVSTMPYAYQWYKNDVAISGATAPTFNITNALQNGIYKLGITIPDFGIVYSNNITINLSLPAVSINNNTVLCEGSDVLLTSTINDGGYAYQWYKDNVAISGATAPLYSANAEGSYYLIVTSGTCTAQSNTIALTIAEITVSSTSPAIDVIIPGETKTLAVTTDAQVPTYAWTRNGVTLANTTSTLNATEDGEYIVTVTQTSGCSASEQRAFTLEYPSGFDLVINTVSGYTACTSTAATLQTNSFTATTTQGIVDVTAMGYALQWYKNDVPVSGATSPTFAVTDASANGVYKLGAAVPGFGVIFSNDIVINLALPTVTITNNSQLCAGSEVIITTNINNPLYSYQWYKDGVLLAGATSHNLTANSEGSYYVTVNSGTCNSTSNSITLAIGTISVNSTTADTSAILPGQSIPLTVTTDAQSPTYSWTRNGVTLSNTTATLNATEDGEYIVTVTQTSGCAATAQKTFTLVYPSAFTLSATETTGYTPCVSTTATVGSTSFTATTINGEVNVTSMNYPLQWYLNDAPVAGAIAATLTISNASQNGIYKLGATVPGFGIIFSNEININLPLPSFVINSNTTLCEGFDVTLSASITNIAYMYQWYKDGVAIAGATALVYSANSEGAYSLEITVNGCTATSNILDLTFATINVNSANPDTAVLIPGQTESLTVTTDAQSPVYSWTLNGNPVSGTSATYNATQAGEYTVTVTQTTGCNATADKTFTLEYPTGFNLAIVANSSYAACSSTTASLNVNEFIATTPGGNIDVTTMGYSYQWYRNGDAVPGATAATLSLSNASQNGTYTLVATIPNFSTVTSNAVTIILGSGSLEIVASGSLCPSTPSVTITPAITDTENNYTWYKDGVQVASGSTAIYTATVTGSYYVVITTPTCTLTSNTIAIEESDFTLTSGNNPVDYIIPGESFILSVSTDAVQPEFVWYRNDVILPGETGTSMAATLDGTYKIVATQTQGCVMSRELTFTLAYPTDFEVQIGAGDYMPCATTTALLSVIDFAAVTPNGPVDIIGDSYGYQWYFEGSPLSGETSNLLDAASSGEYYLEVTIPEVGTIQSNSITLQLGFVDDVVIASDGSLCAEGGEVTITSDIINPQYSYKWYSQSSGDVLGTGISLTVSAPGSYYLAIIYQNCIITSNIVEVETFDTSQVTIDTDPLTTITEGTVTLVTANGASEYQWFFNNVPFATGASVTVSEGGNYSVVATVGECTVTKSFVVSTTRNEVLAIPNVVTPNNDGYNDKWSLPEKYLNNPDVEVIIYDAKGKMVFRESSYNNTWPEIDFEYPLNSPVFYYTITEDLEITKRGSITLIR